MPVIPIDSASIKRIALATDFGDGLYIGQMRARLDELLPGVPVIDLMHDLPPFRPDLAAYLLPAMVRDMPPETLYITVVDPGVGSDRAGLVAVADGRWFVGPDNGLLLPSLRQAERASAWAVRWRPERMTASFHGRDWFVPIAARLCSRGELNPSARALDELVGADLPADDAQVIYVDHFGNLMTGVRADRVDLGLRLLAGRHSLRFARTFSEVPVGEGFWYENSLGLVEIAVNQGRADQVLGLRIGDRVEGLER